MSTLRSTAAALAIAMIGVSCQAATLQFGDQAPSFQAIGADGKEHSLESVSKGAAATVVCFTCTECPVATNYENRFIEFANNYKDRGVRFVAIDVNYNEDLEMVRKRDKQKNFPYPYLYDESGDSARAFGAKVTPQVFLIDGKGTVAYQGAFDDSMSNPTKSYLTDAVDAVLAGKTPKVSEKRAMGCSIQPNRRRTGSSKNATNP